jgi:oxygen-independent coproporphyrinogen-3 oxidase
MISIYIHIPFCLQKCNYCAFVSNDNVSNEHQSNYVLSLIKEIELLTHKYNLINKKIGTIFFGGGTPSILEINALKKILDAIKNNFDFSVDTEISIEVNPATNINFSELKEIGFNRISIGVQSFNDAELKFLGRLHNSELAINTILDAQKEFQNVSIDLIYGIPQQTKTTFEYSLDKAINLCVPHISAYSMTYEQETKFYKMVSQNKIKITKPETEFEMYMMLCNKLVDNNIYQYEVSNFAKKGMLCKHNKKY